MKLMSFEGLTQESITSTNVIKVFLGITNLNIHPNPSDYEYNPSLALECKWEVKEGRKVKKIRTLEGRMGS